MVTPVLSVVIPTLNEAESLPALARALQAALGGRPHEVIIVDDDSPTAPAVIGRNAVVGRRRLRSGFWGVAFIWE